MPLVNFMEAAVALTLEELLSESRYKNLHLTEKVKLDILAYTLNRLPCRYVVTDKGHLYARTDELRQQFKTDIVVELSKAIEYITAHPR